MSAAEDTLAMIEEVGVGRRDLGYPVLWFTVSGDGWGSLQVFSLDDDTAIEILTAVRDVRDLNGRTCVVSREVFGSVKFKKLLPAARTKP